MKIYHKIWNENNPNDPILLNDGNVIHHKDGNRKNNNINNLQKMAKSDHNTFHHKGCKNYFYGKDKKGIKNPMYGRNHTMDTKNRISKTRIQKQLSKGKNNPMYGKKLSKEKRKQLSESMKGENHPNHKLTQMTIDWIRDILNSEEYKEAKNKKLINQTKLAELFGIRQGTISNIKANRIWR